MPRGQRLHQELQQGGFSENLAGNKPKSGIMVSDHGSEQVVPGVASPTDIDVYDVAHIAQLRERGVYFGGWQDDGDSYLDVSRRFPQNRPGREAIDKQAAQNSLLANEQLAGYDVDTGGFPNTGGAQTLFPLDKNVPPAKVIYRNRALRGRGSIFGEAARRQASAALAAHHVQGKLPGI